MGETTSKPAHLQTFLATHTKLKTFKDERYGEITIYRSNSNPEKVYLLKQKWITDRNSELEILNQIQTLKDQDFTSNEDIFNFQGHFKEIQNQMCTSYTKHYTIFDFSSKTLKNEILIWSKKRTPGGHLMVILTTLNLLVHA